MSFDRNSNAISSTTPFQWDDILHAGESYLSLSLDDLFSNISSHYSIDEDTLITALYPVAYDHNERSSITKTATEIIQQVRETHHTAFFDIEELLQEYSLGDEDGVTLMCLAEALLRIPDAKTVDQLIQDKISDREWKRHLDKDNSLFVNASTWGLMITGKLVNTDSNSVSRLFKNSTKPVIRMAVDRAMRIMGQHFVLGRTIKEAMKNAKPYLKKGYNYSYDMLGESAITSTEADRYFQSYADAITKIAENSSDKQHNPTLSIKLSALHPRFEETQSERVLSELSNTVEKLIKSGMQHNVGITIDAEEADRLELTLKLFQHIYEKDFLRGWKKFGLVIQAYSKRALPALTWLTKLAKTHGDEIPIRLVKGAYWDSEIQHSQVFGLDDYPVFTRKEYTDTAYLACARYLLSDHTDGYIYPQFASHNAHTVSSIKVMANPTRAFEFQRLHGMGDSLYDSVIATTNCKVRIYAPVGSHEDLLPYLVRRLLENGANSSFVHQLSDEGTPIEELIRQPLELENISFNTTNRSIPKPIEIYPGRENSTGINLASTHSRETFMNSIKNIDRSSWTAAPIVGGKILTTGESQKCYSPHNHSQCVGSVLEADEKTVLKALDFAEQEVDSWQNTPVEKRSEILEKTADLLEKNKDELVALCQLEAGKSIQDSIDEIREAVDFCRYYAMQAKQKFSEPITLDSPTGESNELFFEGRGIFVCISPWNYPLAIFMGQLTAALVAGNVVIAKPAETTSLIAYRGLELLHEAGLPKNTVQFLPGSGSKIGSIVNADHRISGVAFTGSNATAKRINQTLANRDEQAGIATVIAETGGLNAMIVDSTALPEQVARDVVDSAFSAAGQRCSALRVLYVQAEIADRVIELAKGMMQELSVGNPELISTDIGPVIDQRAQQNLLTYIEDTKNNCLDHFQVELSKDCENGTFIAPTLFEIESIEQMLEEQFGPILHIVRYDSTSIDNVIAEINSKRYGLTFGMHTRNTSSYENIAKRIKVGNVYINRNQIGAVVGVNPFGGCGLSGTGPKAGGPHYLQRFATEKTVTINTAAIGGNIDLLNAV
ncbi:MAG: bifunctional proline dehydrogenase/L-glutamate gamma-semialdehyde dehydrogenase PutA [Arenicella sp.]